MASYCNVTSEMYSMMEALWASPIIMSTQVAPPSPAVGTRWKIRPGTTAEELSTVSRIQLGAAEQLIKDDAVFFTMASNGSTHAQEHTTVVRWWCKLEQLVPEAADSVGLPGPLGTAGVSEWRELVPGKDDDYLIQEGDEVRRTDRDRGDELLGRGDGGWHPAGCLVNMTFKYAYDHKIPGGVFDVRTKTPAPAPEESKDFAQYAQEYYSNRFK